MNDDEWISVIKTLAKCVRDLRITLGWSQQKLADRAGTSQGGISRIEAGEGLVVPFHTVVAIARALAVGARSLDTPLDASTEAMLAFAGAATGDITQPVDPDLEYISRVYNNMGPNHKAAFMEIMRAVVHLVEAHEFRPPKLSAFHVCADSCPEHHDSTS